MTSTLCLTVEPGLTLASLSLLWVPKQFFPHVLGMAQGREEFATFQSSLVVMLSSNRSH